MEDKSILIVQKAVLEAISKQDIDEFDKAELILNLFHFLDIDKYEVSRDILIRCQNEINVAAEEKRLKR